MPVHGVGDALLEGSMELVAKIWLGFWSGRRRRAVILHIQDAGH